MPCGDVQALSLDDEAVVGRLDIHVGSQVAQLGCEIQIDREIMRQVSQPRVFRSDFSGHVNGLIQRKMRMVRLVAYRIERNMLQPLQFQNSLSGSKLISVI